MARATSKARNADDTIAKIASEKPARRERGILSQLLARTTISIDFSVHKTAWAFAVGLIVWKTPASASILLAHFLK